jgi:hypothetical protein
MKSGNRAVARGRWNLGILAWCLVVGNLSAGGFKDFQPPRFPTYYNYNPNGPQLFSDPYSCHGGIPGIGGEPGVFQVVAQMKDGRTLSGNSRICRVNAWDTMRVTLEGETIRPEDTRLLQADGVDGQPIGPAWIFPAAPGRIATYRLHPWPKYLPADYLRKEGGEAREFNDGVLRKMVWDDQEAKGYMVRKAIGKGVFWASMLGAGALFIAAAAVPGVEYKNELGSTYRTSYRNKAILTFSGIGLAIAGTPGYLFTRKNHLDALDTYNRAKP